MTRIQFSHGYEDIISMENLLEAWQEFLRGKKNRRDVQEFQLNLFENVSRLHSDLQNRTYGHGRYHPFKINDPKSRDIHKATVRDRLLHHAIYRKLYPFFDNTFITDSYSCRDYKGTHRALRRFVDFAKRSSFDHTRTVWVLKCDIRKFFASVDHGIQLKILAGYIRDENILRLIERIIGSFHSTGPGVGLPLGNLTSQLLVNIYMNEFDQFVKHELREKYYIRYADDFVVLDLERDRLQSVLMSMKEFLKERLRLGFHPNKISISTLASGVDFLGWVHFPDHRVLRTSTKRRMLRNIKLNPKPETIASYRGMLKHGNAYKLEKSVDQIISLKESQ